MKVYFKFLLLLLGIATIAVACVNEEFQFSDEQVNSTRAPNQWSADCLFSSCTMTCPEGNVVSTGCSFGFAYCNCDAPGKVTEGNLPAIAMYQEFLDQNDFNQEVINVVNTLSDIVANGIWDEYGNVLENYSNIMESLPLEQQELAMEFISSN